LTFDEDFRYVSGQVVLLYGNAQAEQHLLGIQASASDDRVRILRENGPQFAEVWDKVRNLRESLDSKAIALLRNSRTAIDQVWPRLSPHSSSPEIAKSVDELRVLLASDQFIDRLDEIARRTGGVFEAYKKAYLDLFDRRGRDFQSAIEEIRNHVEWGPLETSKPEAAATLIAPLTTRVGTDEDRNAVARGESLGKASLTEMDSDICAAGGLKSSVLVRLQELSIRADEKAPIRRVRVSQFFSKPIQTQAELDNALKLLSDSLQKYIDEGAVIILE